MRTRINESNNTISSEEPVDKIAKSQKEMIAYTSYFYKDKRLQKILENKHKYKDNIFYTIGHNININEKHPDYSITKEEIIDAFPKEDKGLRLFESEEAALLYAQSKTTGTSQQNLNVPVVFKVLYCNEINSKQNKNETVHIHFGTYPDNRTISENIKFIDNQSIEHMVLLEGLFKSEYNPFFPTLGCFRFNLGEELEERCVIS